MATVTGTTTGRSRTLKSILGELRLTAQQAQQLGVSAHTRLSPYLELCCLRVSANVSYEHSEQDVEMFTGIRVAAPDSATPGAPSELRVAPSRTSD